MQRSDIGALIVALTITAALAWGIVYFVQELWPRLPPWLAMLGFIFLAVAVIGYPIYALARWSDRYLERRRAKLPQKSKARTTGSK
jgi:xanthosine utilization system XapX-like protein